MDKAKIILSILFFLGSCQLTTAQSGVSKIEYHCQTQLAKGNGHSGTNTLYFDHHKGLFVHNDWPKESSYEERGTVVFFEKGDPEGMPVFIDLQHKEWVYKSDYRSARHLWIFREPLPHIAWELLPEQKTIGGFTCTKATGNFGGRIYDVWFTPNLPVSLGPYKLWGLPGMILEAKSRDGRVAYHFQAYYPEVEEEIVLAPPTEGKEVSWEAFEEFVIGRLLWSESRSTDEVFATEHDPPSDWEIEKDKWAIIGEYKTQRRTGNKR
ncbi:MAG: GLPGLI family protein [Phaeodactylibacter sp.]|nr:GLPGLI family protein [Phaeodactylibacter sp.]